MGKHNHNHKTSIEAQNLAMCRRRVRKLERLIRNMLDAHDTGEMSVYQASIAALRRALEQI